MKDLRNKVIVVTGASSGLGRAIANELAATGCVLMLAARREQALHEVADECRELGATVYPVVTDVRNADDVAHLARYASEVNGTIEAWINNAGVLAAGELDDIPPEVNSAVIQTNLVGFVNGAQQVLPFFKNQGYGTLINNISVGGWFPTPFAAAYTASKFGARGFSEALKGELANYPRIHVVDLYPGFLDTPGIQHAANYTGKSIKPAPPVLDPMKVARAVLHLLQSPQPSKTIGISSAFLRLSYQLFPDITRSVTATFIRTYLKRADEIADTSGNVLDSVEFGTGVYGGWSENLKPKKSTVGLALLALVGTLIIWGYRKGSSSAHSK